MNSYFSANQLHLEGFDMIDVAPRVPLLATYGSDNFVFTIDPNSGNKTQYEIHGRESFTSMTLAPDGSHCLFATENKILKYEFDSQTLSKLAEDVCYGNVKILRYSSSGEFVAVGGEDGKPAVFQSKTGLSQKCRPGHKSQLVSIFLSRDDQFLGSIGKDQDVAIYQQKQKKEVARYQITRLQDCTSLSASFHFSKPIVYLPGQRFLQTIQLLDSRWQFIRLEKISHGENIILLTQTVKENTLVSSSDKQVCIWNLTTQEKLFEIQQFNLNAVVPVVGTFFGMRGDGKMYRYIREIKEQEPMEIQEERPQDRIQFEEAQSEQGENQSQEKKSQVQYQVQKKSKADKIITCLPQAPVTSSTSVFDGQRFLFANEHGCVIQRLQANEQKTIEVEFGLQNPKKMIISHGRQMMYFDLNPFALIYATEKQFGVKILPSSEGESSEATWINIKSIALGCGWLAVANEQEIKLFDMCLHEIKTIAFDRQIIALRAHQNMLCIVYHESVPMWGSQQLAMQLILVDSSMRNANMLSTVQVPVRPGSILRSFHFSQEGMLFSQDSSGSLRAFSLERGDWTPVGIVGLQDTRKAWIIGVVNMEVLYWKTSNEDPEPTVAPRFAIKSSSLYIPTIGAYPKQTQQAYQQLLWARFSLDHEKARTRLWGRIKTSRATESNYYYLVSSIISQKQIAVRHQELDQKFFNLVQSYLKQDQPLRAFSLAKSCLRTIESTRKLVQLFDYFNKRQLAIQLEEYCDQRQRQLEYEQMQIFEFMKMREAAERTIKPRSEDPMRRGTKRINDSIPSFSQNMSQESIDGISSVAKITGSQASHPSQVTVQSQQLEQQNPFLKRKSTNEQFEAKKKEIFDHVQKFGIKKKVEEKSHKRNKV